MLVSRTNYLEEGIASTNSNVLSARNKITDLEARMHQEEQRAARLKAHVRYLQYKDIIGRIRWLEGVVFDAGLDTEGNWARYYEDYDHEADWDAWIDNEVRGDIEESTSSGETSSDSSDSDTCTTPLPD